MDKISKKNEKNDQIYKTKGSGSDLKMYSSGSTGHRNFGFGSAKIRGFGLLPDL